MPDKDDKKNSRHDAKKDTGDLLWEMATRDVTPLIEKDGGFMKLAPDATNEKDEPDHFFAETSKKTQARPGQENKKHPSPPIGKSGAPQDKTMFTGLDHRTNERLRRGKMPIEAVLDLHGCRRVEAYEVLKRFLYQSYEDGKRCVLIVTGKGQRAVGTGVIKQSFPDWIRDPAVAPFILQYYPAKPQHGGAGAFYVLLRKKR